MKMKMTKAHYDVLKERVQMLVNSGQFHQHVAKVRAAGNYKNLATRVMWDTFHACRMYDKYTYQEFDYLDSHVDTALKSIFKELGIVID